MYIHICASAQLLQACLTLCNPRDCSPLGSSVHRILPARILQWVAMPFFRGSSQPRDWTHVFCMQADPLLLSHLGSPTFHVYIHVETLQCGLMLGLFVVFFFFFSPHQLYHIFSLGSKPPGSLPASSYWSAFFFLIFCMRDFFDTRVKSAWCKQFWDVCWGCLCQLP